MNDDRFDVLDRFEPLFEAPEPAFEGFVRRRDRRRRNQRITAGAVGIAVFVAAIWFVTSAEPAGLTQTPGVPAPTGPAGPTTTAPWFSPSIATAPYYAPDARSEVDYVIDLRNGEMTPLPQAITGSLGEDHQGNGFDPLFRYAASSDGSTLAFVGTGEEGTPQIFIAGIDGTGVRQVTHDPTRATAPAWSPDGTSIAYSGYGDGTDVPNVFVLDVATGATTQITYGEDDGVVNGAWDPTFTPDGRSVLYTGGPNEAPELRIVPVAGGESSLLIVPDHGLSDSGNGSMSPDGTLVTFLGGGFPTGEGHCGPCRLVANADGTGRRVIPGWMATPAGIWSPDSSRIVTMDIAPAYPDLPPTARTFIVVIDVATGEAKVVANGQAAIWLDDHTLLVAV